MNLYELATIHNEAFMNMAEIDDLSEEVINDTLEALEGEFNDKAISIAAFIMNMEADVKAIKEAENRLSERRKKIESKIEWFKKYLSENMLRTGILKIECPYYKVSLQDNPWSVQVIDESMIPEKYKTIETITKIDKNAIKSDGGCDGVTLGRTKRLVIK